MRAAKKRPAPSSPVVDAVIAAKVAAYNHTLELVKAAAARRDFQQRTAAQAANAASAAKAAAGSRPGPDRTGRRWDAGHAR